MIRFNKMIVAEQKAPASSPQDFDKTCLIEENEVNELIDKSTEILLSQPMLLELIPPLNICGMKAQLYYEVKSWFFFHFHPFSTSSRNK